MTTTADSDGPVFHTHEWIADDGLGRNMRCRVCGLLPNETLAESDASGRCAMSGEAWTTVSRSGTAMVIRIECNSVGAAARGVALIAEDVERGNQVRILLPNIETIEDHNDAE